jgi:hypothetical protein
VGEEVVSFVEGFEVIWPITATEDGKRAYDYPKPVGIKI